jgi:hypothetical protein
MTRLPLRVKLAVLARSLLIQGSWNYRTMVGTGMGFTLLPALRHLHRKPDELDEAVARHSMPFNAHPYLAELAIGSLVRLETDGADAQTVGRFRSAVGGPLGALGDRVVWAVWLPLTALVGLVAFEAGLGAGTAVVLFLALYNAGHFLLRCTPDPGAAEFVNKPPGLPAWRAASAITRGEGRDGGERKEHHGRAHARRGAGKRMTIRAMGTTPTEASIALAELVHRGFDLEDEDSVSRRPRRLPGRRASPSDASACSAGACPTVPHDGGAGGSGRRGDRALPRIPGSMGAHPARGTQAGTEERLGPVEARIFEPQLLMLDDDELSRGRLRYIRENRLTAARAFEWRMLELQALWIRTANPMVLDRLNDLEDLQVRLLHRLLDLPDPGDLARRRGDPPIVVARNLTPSLTVQMDPETVRASRPTWARARPTGPSWPARWAFRRGGARRHLDARQGGPGGHRRRADRPASSWTPTSATTPGLRERRSDPGVGGGDRGHRAARLGDEGRAAGALRANLDLPGGGGRPGARGRGGGTLPHRVPGRGAQPRCPARRSSTRPTGTWRRPSRVGTVFIRTFDLGGDKFPMFLHMPAEENPFLGWRAIRVCLDEPELFRTQLRAILRATAHGDVRIMLPW